MSLITKDNGRQTQKIRQNNNVKSKLTQLEMENDYFHLFKCKGILSSLSVVNKTFITMGFKMLVPN